MLQSFNVTGFFCSCASANLANSSKFFGAYFVYFSSSNALVYCYCAVGFASYALGDVMMKLFDSTHARVCVFLRKVAAASFTCARSFVCTFMKGRARVKFVRW
jgi:hypothetical protein